MINKNARIYITGHTGMVGIAVRRRLEAKGYKNLILKTPAELDLRNKNMVEELFKIERPEYVFHFAAKVGGISANISYPAAFLYDNIMISANVINASHAFSVKKLLYLSSSCCYPGNCPQPMEEKRLLSGRLEPTNEAYAMAKIVGLKLCEYYNRQFGTNFIVLVAPNLYGPNDNFDLNSAHVIAALIRKFTDARLSNRDTVEIWGAGKARREFLYVDDIADASIYFMNTYAAKDLPPFVNVGSGSDVTIKELVDLIKETAAYKGRIEWNKSMPDGMPRKLLDLTLLKKYNWKSKISLPEGIKKTCEWYMGHVER